MSEDDKTLGHEIENQGKAYFSIERLIYAISCLEMSYIIFRELVVSQSAVFMMVSCVIFIGLAINFFKRLLIIYNEKPYENRKPLEKYIDGFGMLVVIFLLFRAIG
ncbi:hypothetical protein CSC2_44250 [Clostridium zeae]|uniref:Uncharacterized protein n=1 Tax=Clostridium zeae TaxID=2759022 RepID=A0ABQ1EGY3_9CLOT|nr:hypothetical protein [Clostridium zeae]GFZ33899.1 hypothetical protein CSC2_44250 [Clostridium zeae]